MGRRNVNFTGIVYLIIVGAAIGIINMIGSILAHLLEFVSTPQGKLIILFISVMIGAIVIIVKHQRKKQNKKIDERVATQIQQQREREQKEHIERIKLSHTVTPPIKKLFDELWHVLQDFIDTKNSKKLINFCNHLLSMKHENGNNIDFLPAELRYKVSDCFVLIGQYENALEFFPLPFIGGRAGMYTNQLLSLKLATKNRLTGYEVLTLLGPKVTDFGKEHLTSVLSEINSILDLLWSTTKVDYIAEWAEEAYKDKYQVGIGTYNGYFLTKHVSISGYTFSNNPKAIEFIANITREAENSIRQKIGVPKVGEGWVAETQLYYKIKQAFSNLDVKQHVSPKWLGRQHLDIFIPSMSVGIEYQGEQHDRPVDFFGGQEAFIKIQKLDQRKLQLCKKNGVYLIYVRSGYTLQNIIAEIESVSQSGVF